MPPPKPRSTAHRLFGTRANLLKPLDQRTDIFSWRGVVRACDGSAIVRRKQPREMMRRRLNVDQWVDVKSLTANRYTMSRNCARDLPLHPYKTHRTVCQL